MSAPVDLLARPVYGMAEVDSVLRLPAGTARRWIDGYKRHGKEYPPIVRERATGDELVTWGELVETRLLSEYRTGGVPIINLRPTVQRLRQDLAVQYPLAHAHPWLEQDGRELVARIQDELQLPGALRFVVVRNDQLLLTAPARRFVDTSTFEGVVTNFRPDADVMNVVVDPIRQFGRPVVRSVPTEIIAELYDGGDRIEEIAERYELSPALVQDALRYEFRRARAAAA